MSDKPEHPKRTEDQFEVALELDLASTDPELRRLIRLARAVSELGRERRKDKGLRV